MKLISFNTNGIRARMHQLERLIDKHQPDIIGIQETKVADDQFPVAQIEAMGYHAVYHGQKTHYGVCLLSREPASQVEYGFPGDEPDAQRRMIMAEFTSSAGTRIKVLNGYFPQGENIAHETKFPAKRRFYADLLEYLRSGCSPDQPLILMGRRSQPQTLAQNRKDQLPAGRAPVAGTAETLGAGGQLPGATPGGGQPVQLV